MELKYLPIGSVCTLKGKNKKVMIIGYYSVEFNGNLKINDYCGCDYPEGMLLPDKICTFNHTDIEKIDFVGFKNEEQRKFNALLDRLTGNDNQAEKASEFHKENDMFLTSNSTYSKLLFDENGVVMIADPVVEKPKEKKESIFKDIVFDEKGYVVSAGVDSINNPFHKEYKIEEKKEEVKTSNWNIFNRIEFDENGTVINDNSNIETQKETMLNKIEFDENGTVISVNSETLKENDNQYEFDENGTVINDNSNIETQKETMLNKIEFDENGTVISVNGESLKENDNQYEFDENGTVVSVSQAVTSQSQSLNNIQFDENGTVVSA